MTQQIFDTHTAYKPLVSLPWVVFPYTPGYFIAARLAGAMMGNLLAAGRALSLVSTMGICLAIGLTVLKATPDRIPLLWRLAAAAFGGAAPLAADSVLLWAPLMRVDMLALLFMYSGLAVYIVLGKRERWQFAAGAIFLLALFTKETMVSGPLACLIFGLLACPARTIRLYASLAVAGLAGVFWLNAVTHGGFLTHIVQYNRNPFSWRFAVSQVYQHVHDELPSVVLGAAALLTILRPAQIRRNGWKRFLRVRCARPYDRAVAIASLNAVLAAISMLAIGKAGASVNYFLGWDISIGLLCGLLLFRLLATWETRARPGSWGSLILAALLVLAVLVPSVRLVASLLPSPDRVARAKHDAALVRILRATPGPVMSENLLLPFQAGKPVEIEPATLSFLARAGQWDERRYTALLDRQYFRVIVAHDIHDPEHYTPAVAAAIERAYFLERKVGTYMVYRPASTAAQGSSSEMERKCPN